MASAAARTTVLRIDNVLNCGEAGQFRANNECLGWRSSDGVRTLLHPTSSVRRAEWFEGRLRILCETDGGGGSEVISLEGFADGDFDQLWRFFEQNCAVYLRKHRAVAALSETDYDGAMRSIEDAADRVDDATKASVQKKAREADLMKKVESVRDGLEQAVSGDKQALSRVFSANGCERIGRMRLVIDTVHLEVYRKDERWVHLRKMCDTIEAVLRELGTFRSWKPPDDAEHSSLARRQMVRELRQRQGEVGEYEDLDGSSATVINDGGGDSNAAEALNPLRSGAGNSGPGRVALPTAGYPAYGAAHPQYGAPPPPLPEPAPAAAPAADQSDVAVGEKKKVGVRLAEEEEEEDVEVSDPNSFPADRRKAKEKASGLGEGDQGGRRIRYTHPGSVLEGWVWKRSRFLRRWRRRWLVLMPKQLMSFKQRGQPEPTETVDAGAVLHVYSADSEVLQAKCFCVSIHKRNFYMVCDDEAQKREWMQEIARALGTKYR